MEKNEQQPERFQPIQESISKREYFAAMAMQGILANFYHRMGELEMDATDITRDALLYVDELLSELNTK